MIETITPRKTLRSPLKWAGGKYQLIPALRSLFQGFDTRDRCLIEPFVGSGVVWLNCYDLFSWVEIHDANPALVAFYRVLESCDKQWILDRFQQEFENSNSVEVYLKKRDRFNRLIALLDLDDFNVEPEEIEVAALLVYLNRHCFNGLFRVNKQGGFNVPFGRYKKPKFPQMELEAMIGAIADGGRITQSAEMQHPSTWSSFEDSMKRPFSSEELLFYCDPPYLGGFDTYSKGGMSHEQHQLLATLARQIADRGGIVIISNHDLPETRSLYCDADEIRAIEVQRLIACNGDRPKAKELFAIYKPQ